MKLACTVFRRVYYIIYKSILIDNFAKVKVLINLLRESCFLTLCRKHNKSKSWAYSVYTPNLILSRSLFSTKSFFPSRKNVIKMKKKFVINSYFPFDEEFFIFS